MVTMMSVYFSLDAMVFAGFKCFLPFLSFLVYFGISGATCLRMGGDFELILSQSFNEVAETIVQVLVIYESWRAEGPRPLPFSRAEFYLHHDIKLPAIAMQRIW